MAKNRGKDGDLNWSMSQSDASEQIPQHDSIMVYLKKTVATNQALLKYEDDLESQKEHINANETPIDRG